MYRIFIPPKSIDKDDANARKRLTRVTKWHNGWQNEVEAVL